MEGDNKSVKKSNSETYASVSLNLNTSILDFKSPKIESIKEIKLFNFESTKSKNSETRLKINLDNIVDNEAGSSKQVQAKISNDAHMQTVSNMLSDQENVSTNLPNNTRIAYVCPLCFKNYKDNNSRIFHMKNCAIKNQVSMKKLLQAIELQERQSAERASLGLPGAPILQNKRQTSIRRMPMKQDSQLQLALALSKSLYEVEEIKNSNPTEQDFIIASTKNPVENITSRIQRKSMMKYDLLEEQNISVLQIRSQEERDRLLTEKIAEILVDNETLIQRQQQAKNENDSRKKADLRSHVLKKHLNFDNQLWNAAMLQSSQTNFFVKDLSPYIIPSEHKQTFMEYVNESHVMKKPQPKNKLPTTYDSYLNKEESSNISHRMDIKLFADIKKENIKQSCINNLIIDWGNALNNSSSSDVIIFVNGDKQIWVHKLVFYVRCPNILLDIIPNENTVYSVKERICWTDVEYYIALAFLEFIYCGIIEKYSIFCNDNIAISSLGCLARRYKVKELFSYLRHVYVISHDSISMDNELEIDEQGIQEIYYTNDEQNQLTLIPDRDSNVVKCSNQDTFNITTMEVSHNQLLKTNMLSPEKYTIPASLIDRENSISPDIFDDIDNITLNHSDNTKFINIENSKNKIEYDLLSPNQHNSQNIATNRLLSPPLTNKNRNSTDECMLMKSIMVTPRINQKEVPDTMTDEVKPKSDLTLFIEEVQKENAKSDSEIDSEIQESSPSKLFIKNNRNPFKKGESTESSIILDRFDNSEHSLSKAEKKVSNLSKLESDMQMYAIENPQLCNITIDESLKFTTPGNHNRTDLSSPTREDNISISCNDEPLEKIIHSVQENNVSITRSYCSSSETDTDDANISMYTKYKRKHVDNSIAIYRSAVKKRKNNITKIEIDKKEISETIISDRASNLSNVTKCAYNDVNHTRNDNLNVPSLSNISMDENFSIIQMGKNTSNLEFSRKSKNGTEIYNNALKDNISWSTESVKMPDLDKWNNDKLIISCDSFKTQITSDESFNNDCSSILYSHSSELPDIEKQHSSPLKSSICSSPILISSSPDIDLNNADNYDFSNYDNEHVVSSNTQEFDHELQHFSTNETNCSNVEENSPLQICGRNKKSRKRSRSDGSLQCNYAIEKDCESCEFDSTYLRQCSRQNNYKPNATNRLLTVTESSDVSSPNYDIMDTPELNEEMEKYGLKTQKREKIIKLLTYIYNELNPTISSCETPGANVEDIDNKDEKPQQKKNKHNIIKYECNMSPLKTLDSKDYSMKARTKLVANVNIENVITLNNCGNIAEAFSKLLNFNKDLHNSILRYEPQNLELIHSMLKAGGFKCNVSVLKDFLDEQCIIFYLPDLKKARRETREGELEGYIVD